MKKNFEFRDNMKAFILSFSVLGIYVVIFAVCYVKFYSPFHKDDPASTYAEVSGIDVNCDDTGYLTETIGMNEDQVRNTIFPIYTDYKSDNKVIEEEELTAYERRINKEIENGMYSKRANCYNIEMLVVPGHTDYLLQYAETVKEYKPNRVAFIFFDGDDIPDLLMDTEGKYSLYTYAGGQPTKVLMNMHGDDADAWVQREDFFSTIYYMPFDYAPYMCMTRVCFNHTYDESVDGINHYVKYDSITTYNRYIDGVPITELCNNNDSAYNSWRAYYDGSETDNYTYQLKRLELRYDELVSCEYMYYNLAEAYLNIGREPEDAMTVFDRYINNGGMDQYMQHVSQFYYGDISEFFDYHIDFTDFDDDGETEMIVKHYMGYTDYYETIGDEAVCVMRAGSGTADATDLKSDGFRTLIFRGDVTHVGRKVRTFVQLDTNGCVLDVTTLHWFSNTGNDEYRSDDQYSYDKVSISRELYKTLVEYYSQDLLHPIETVTAHDILYKYPGVGGENREKLIADEKKIYMIEHAAGDTKASENSSQNAKTVSVKVDKELAENYKRARLWVWQDRSHEDDQPVGGAPSQEYSNDWIFAYGDDEAKIEVLNPYNMTRIVRYDDGSLRDEWETGRPMNYGHVDVSYGFDIKAIPMEEAIDGYNPMYILLAFDNDGNQYQYRVYE